MASRHGRALFMLFEDDQTYVDKLKSMFGANLLAYWEASELSGGTLFDKTQAARNLTYTSSETLNNAISPNGKPCPLFNAAIDANPAIVSVFDGQEGAIGGFLKHDNWASGAEHYILNFYADANNDIFIDKAAANNSFFFAYVAGADAKSFTVMMNRTGFYHWMISWSLSGDSVVFYINGVPVQSFSSVGTFVGALAANFTKLAGWFGSDTDGNMSDIFLANRAVTKQEARRIGTAVIRPRQISILGDSIPYIGAPLIKWPELLAELGYNSGWVANINHAAGGATIMAQMDGQTTATATDDSDIIIIQLGYNDDNAGNMATLQAEYEENIAELKASNKNATIYSMNILPCWTDVGGGTVTDKSNIRTAIAAACTAQAITCWDTFTDPWIVVADTSDGTHPTQGGHDKIAARVLALLP